MKIKEKYEAIIGLEVHAQLRTKTKAYSSDENIYGETPNTKTSVISLGHPGTLPTSNKKVIEYAVKLGLAVGSKVRRRNEYARKNYFYADLPKGYQISQDKTPICNGGCINILDEKDNIKKIAITRIHMEEDAGKNIHDIDPFNSLIDLNRAGVPLLEIVSEPDLRSSQEAFQYINEIRKLVKYLEICDGNMEEGSLRCDANISVRLKGEKKFGTKVEVKNMNSTNNIKKAIDFEIQRQIKALEKGESIAQETRSFNATKGNTISMRSKEEANDYRYFPEPDLQPIIISNKYITEIKNTLPPLPHELVKKFTQDLKLSKYDANILTDEKDIALYFNNLCQYITDFKTGANFMNGCIKSHLNKYAITINELEITPKQLSNLINLITDGKISYSIANNKIFPEMLSTKKTAQEIAHNNNWIKESNDVMLKKYIEDAISKYPEKVSEYKNGKKGLIGLFMGEVMKISKGKADPKIANKLLQSKLDN